MHQHLLRPVTFAIVLVSRFSGHKASLLGAALAYYAVFSLGPLMVIAIAGFVFGDEAAHGEVSAQLKNLLGDNGAQAVEAMLAGADRHHNGLVAATIGVGTLGCRGCAFGGDMVDSEELSRLARRRDGPGLSTAGLAPDDDRANGRSGVHHAVHVDSAPARDELTAVFCGRQSPVRHDVEVAAGY
jgi:hypothetical protein